MRFRRFALVCTTACVGLGPTTAGRSIAQEVEQDPNRTCFMCHGDPANFASREDHDRLIVTREEFTGSVHGGFGMSCTTCHSGYAFPHPEEYTPVDCGKCHGGVEGEYHESVHGYALTRGNERAPSCVDCHGVHDILKSDDPESPTYRTNIASTCIECHSSGGLLTDEYVRLPAPGRQYAQSVHGRALAGADEEGGMSAATCTDCHGVHDLKGHNDPRSRINRLNVSATCGECHGEVTELYDRSIHGRAVAAGIGDSPTCTGCHGEHQILSPDDPDAATYAGQLANEVCGDCHGDPEIIAKYDFQHDVLHSYQDSYHAWATRRDVGYAATCVSCHNAHLVLPAADPESSISEANVVETCGQCHEGATVQFARSYDHAAASAATNRGKRIVTALYIGLIVVVIGGMVLHNVIIMAYYAVEKRRRERRERSVVRFDRAQIFMHATLAISFIVLVLTGFALRYPDALWVKWLGLASLSEPVRSWTHRVAGSALILLSVWHVWWAFATRRGRQEAKAMLPRFQDLLDFVENMRYYLRNRTGKPGFDQYDYTQKAEYWAVVWGTGLMAATGIVLWFPTWATSWAPAWIISISETIHFYEAWLATLAIIVWHFFFVIFHPEVYPMSWIWLTGKMPEHEVQSVHGRWYEEEVAELLDREHGEAPAAGTAAVRKKTPGAAIASADALMGPGPQRESEETEEPDVDEGDMPLDGDEEDRRSAAERA